MATTAQQHASFAPSEKLEDQAASSALRASRETTSPKASSHGGLLDPDGRLSSAGAATSLKYARAQDLPSFPSQGGVALNSAGGAATLANDSHKPFEHWKPQPLPAANKAAMQAKDYEMDPLWHPEQSKAGSRAALLAARDTKTVPAIYTPSVSDHSKSSTPSSKGTRDDGQPSDARKAMMAATGAMATSRRRADSAPIKPQKPAPTSNPNANASWALKAATASQRAGVPKGDFAPGDPGFDAARIQNTAKGNINRQMYGSKPPVAIEVEEKNRQDMLRASAIAMAQKMYAIQQQHLDDAKSNKHGDSTTGARVARNRALSDTSSTSESKPVPHQYQGLEEAARQLAQQRLAKIHDEHAEYRQYYGANVTPGKPSKKPTFRRNRRRANSTNDADDSDEEDARKIRSQMSLFQGKLAEVDSKKRQADRDALLEAAHRNVTKQMNTMDAKVFEQTGKASPQQRELWERQARERAQRDSDARMVNVGKVHIGGGKYLDQEEVDAIARARLQPTLDEISDKAEKQRAADEEARLDAELKKREADNERMRQQEVKNEMKATQAKQKQEEKDRLAEEKRVRQSEAAAIKQKQNEERAAEKAKQQEQRAVVKAQEREEKAKRQEVLAADKERARQDKEEKRKSTAVVGAGTVAAAVATTTTHDEVTRPRTSDTEDARPSTSGSESTEPAEESVYDNEDTAEDTAEVAAVKEGEDEKEEEDRIAAPTPVSPEPAQNQDTTVSPTVGAEEPTSPASPSKRNSRMKSWIKSRFRSSSSAQVSGSTAEAEQPTISEPIKGSADEDKARSDSMRDVAMAGRTTANDEENEDMYGDGVAVEPVSPVKEAAKDDDEPGPAVQDRSPSISSISSDEEAPRTATTAISATDPSSGHEPHFYDEVTSEESQTKVLTDKPPSEVTESDTESRGRKGFRSRFLNRVKSINKSKKKQVTIAEEEPTTHKAPIEQTGTEDEPIEETNTVTTEPHEDNDDFEEAKDTFEEEKLAPPPKLTAAATGSPRGSRERSKFTEDL